MRVIKKNALFLCLIFIGGIISGWFYGNYITGKFLKGDIGISNFLFLPSKNMIDTFILLNSQNELKRLEGYYAYRETGLKDHEFLYRRYRDEDSDIIRKTIIWIVENDDNVEELNKFYKKLYEVTSGTLKRYLQKKINSYELIEQQTQLNQGEGQ